MRWGVLCADALGCCCVPMRCGVPACQRVHLTAPDPATRLPSIQLHAPISAFKWCRLPSRSCCSSTTGSWSCASARWVLLAPLLWLAAVLRCTAMRYPSRRCQASCCRQAAGFCPCQPCWKRAVLSQLRTRPAGCGGAGGDAAERDDAQHHVLPSSVQPLSRPKTKNAKIVPIAKTRPSAWCKPAEHWTAPAEVLVLV